MTKIRRTCRREPKRPTAWNENNWWSDHRGNRAVTTYAVRRVNLPQALTLWVRCCRWSRPNDLKVSPGASDLFGLLWER